VTREGRYKFLPMRINLASVLVVEDGIPFTAFAVDNVQQEYERLSALGVRFTQEPVSSGPVTTAVLDDTCGNLIQIVAAE
jgi:predicted enzyme related to lactoylglutathione lyase